MDSTINIYFEVTWTFKDGRPDRPPHIFHVEFFRDALDFLPSMENDDYKALNNAFSKVLQKEFPDFNDKEFKLTSLDICGEKMLLEKRMDGYDGLTLLIAWNKKTVFTKGSKPIQLRIEQRRLSAAQCEELKNKKPAADIHLNPSCSECLRVIINGSLFQCIQCEGKYIMCGSCVTSGKHPEHIIVRATGSKVNSGAQFEAQMKDLQNYCKTIRFSSDKEILPENSISVSNNSTEKSDINAENPSASSSFVMKTEDADAKSDSSSVCSDGWVLENGTVESSTPSSSAVQEAPIETLNPDHLRIDLELVPAANLLNNSEA